MQVTLFGPLRVSDRGRHLEVGGARLRTLLTRLALAPGEIVGTHALVEGLWEGEPPTGAGNALQSLVSRLRRALPAGSVESERVGYRLAVGPDQVDVVRFERLITDGRRALGEGRREEGLASLERAEGLWQGTPLLDAGDVGFARAAAVRLTDLRLAAAEERFGASLRDAGPRQLDEMIDEARGLVDRHPLHERLLTLLMTALYRAGGHAEALQTYEAFRGRLAEELGADPSEEATRLHLAILRHEPGLGREPGPGDAPDDGPGDGPDDRPGERPDTGHRRTGPAAGGEPERRPAEPEAENAFGARLRTARLTSFVGRERERAELAASWEPTGAPGVRLLTIVGPGGAGKTRLAVESAATDSGPVWLVELAGLAGPQDVPNAVLAALGGRDSRLLGRMDQQTGPLDAFRRIERMLADRDGLLVLDNCEHVVGAVAELADRLLAGCRRLRILTTSRESLGVPGERLYPIPRLPDGAAERLFADRARAVDPGFALDERNGPLVRTICAELDRLPLAIELAAARVRTLPVPEIAARLRDRFRLLASGSRTVVARHRTLRSVVEWSWDLLSGPERELAGRIAVFAGGASIRAIEQVCRGDLDTLGQLVDKSLLEPVRNGREGRFRMLETVRAYALEQLEKAGEATAIRNAHAAFFVRFVEIADDQLRTDQQLDGLARLAEEHDNVLAATRWAVDIGDAATAVRLVARMCWFWFLRGHRHEATVWLREALDVDGETPAGERGMATFFLALSSWGSGDSERGNRLVAETSELAADQRVRDAFPLLALVRVIAPRYTNNRQGAIDETLALLSRLPDWHQGMAYAVLAHLEEYEGNLSRAVTLTTEARRVFDRLGERWGQFASARFLADHRVREGRSEEAMALYRGAMAHLDELGAVEDQAQLIGQIGITRARMGDLDGAERDLRTCRAMALRSDLDGDLFISWLVREEFELHRGNLPRARSLLDEGLSGRVDGRQTSVPSILRASMLRLAATVEILDDRTEIAAGYLDEAFELALAERDLPALAMVVDTRAALAVRTGAPERAAYELGLAVALRGGPDHSGALPIPVELEARAALGDQTYERIVERGACTDRNNALVRLGSGHDVREGRS